MQNFDRIPQIIRDTGEISADYIKLTFDAINESLIGAVGNATVSYNSSSQCLSHQIDMCIAILVKR